MVSYMYTSKHLMKLIIAYIIYEEKQYITANMIAFPKHS